MDEVECISASVHVAMTAHESMIHSKRLKIGELEGRIAANLKEKAELEQSKERTLREVRRLVRKGGGGGGGSIASFLTATKRQKTGGAGVHTAELVPIPFASGHNQILIGIYNGILLGGDSSRLVDLGSICGRAVGRISEALFTSATIPSLAAVAAARPSGAPSRSHLKAAHSSSLPPPLWSLSSHQLQPGWAEQVAGGSLVPEEVRLLDDAECAAGLSAFFVDERAEMERALQQGAEEEGDDLYGFISQRSPQQGGALSAAGSQRSPAVGGPNGPSMSRADATAAIRRLLSTVAGDFPFAGRVTATDGRVSSREVDCLQSDWIDLVDGYAVAGRSQDSEGGPEAPLVVHLLSRYKAALTLLAGSGLLSGLSSVAPGQSQGRSPLGCNGGDSSPCPASGSSANGYRVCLPSAELRSPPVGSLGTQVDLVSPEGTVVDGEEADGDQAPCTQRSDYASQGGGIDAADVSIDVDLSAEPSQVPSMDGDNASAAAAMVTETDTEAVVPAHTPIAKLPLCGAARVAAQQFFYLDDDEDFD